MFAAHCCCSDCQKASGADHITVAFFKEDQVSISGETKEYSAPADSGNINSRVFCPTCGGRLFSRNSAREGMIGVQIGSMDNADIVSPSVAVFARNRRPWDTFSDKLAVFETSPPPK